MAGIPLRLDAVLAKKETTYRTDAVPVAGTDGVRLAERLWPSLTVDYAWENLLEDVATGTILPAKPALPRGRRVTLDIPWLPRGAGVDAPVEASPLLQACGLTETDGVSLFDYDPASQLHSSATIYAYAAGHLFKAVGCRGSFRITFQAGQIVVMRFRMQGFLGAEPAPAAVPTTTYDATEPVASVGLSATVGSWTPELVSGEFDAGATVEQQDDSNDTDGIKAFEIGLARPTLTLVTRVPRNASGIWDQATFDPWADVKACTARAINITWGSAQFARLKLIVAATDGVLQSAPAPEAAAEFSAWRLVYRLLNYKLRTD
ncbi:MAG TPA: phage tail tube protein [Gemmatimonadales bacterium]|nr:phage tail tube protein [Gemmatimonadales bacterium]